jgi:pyruvate/2-oxoacid:ferredoxin oxidoreductase beta subunit
MLKKYEELFSVKEEFMLPCGRSCPGCGGGIITRFALKAVEGKNVVLSSGSCGTNTTGIFPIGPMARVAVPVTMLGAFGGVFSGIREALNVTGREDATVLGIVGDGDAADIGFGLLSGMIERRHKVALIIQDNQGYAATGGQRSGTTPLKAWTRTTPDGKKQPPKQLPFIFMAHDIPYTATAAISHPEDLFAKIKKALKPENQPSLIQALSPCVPNWKIDPKRTIEVTRLAVETGFWPLYEYERGSFRRTVFIKEKKPLQEFLKIQGRFAHVTKEDIKDLQGYIDQLEKKIEGYLRFYSMES